MRATRDFKSETTTCFMKKNLVAKPGAPKALLSDQEKKFEAKLTDEFCKENGIKKLRTTSYHAQANGLDERTIRTVKQVVSCYVNDTHDNWDEVLPDVVFTYNYIADSSTGVAPNQIIFGKSLESPTDRRLNIQMSIVDRSSVEKRAAENIRRAQHQQNISTTKELTSTQLLT